MSDDQLDAQNFRRIKQLQELKQRKANVLLELKRAGEQMVGFAGDLARQGYLQSHTQTPDFVAVQTLLETSGKLDVEIRQATQDLRAVGIDLSAFR